MADEQALVLGNPNKKYLTPTETGLTDRASQPTPSEPPPPTPDPFAAMGGGTYVNGGWIPNNNPDAIARARAAAGQSAPAPSAPAPTAAAPAAPTAPTGPTGPITTAGGTTSSTSTAGASGVPTTIAESFRDALVSKLNPGPIDASNAAIAPAIAANKLAEQRGVERNRNTFAEQAARDGTDASGGSLTNTIGLQQDSAARQGQFAGNAVQHLSDQQNANVLAALGLSNQALQQNALRDQQGSQFSQSLSEQQREADQNAANQRLGINTQGSLGQGDLSLRDKLGSGGLNLQLLSLLQGGDQFNRQLGQQGAQFGQSLDQSGLLGLLGLL